MIVDCHTHLWRAEHWSAEMEREASIARGAPAMTHVENIAHWEAMRPVGKAVAFGFRSNHLGLVVPNELIAAYVAEHPEKLIGFASLDCTEAGYLDEMRRSFEDLRLSGLKLAPIYQNFHPMDARMQPVYEYCERHGLPMLIHQGTTFARRAPLKYALPVQLEDVALAYPDLVIVIAHMGHPWINETIALMRKQPNVYADISALYYRPWQFYNALVAAVEYGAAHKLLFGSDYPFTTPEATIRGLQQVNAVTGNSGLPRVPDEVIQGILHRDTLSILGI